MKRVCRKIAKTGRTVLACGPLLPRLLWPGLKWPSHSVPPLAFWQHEEQSFSCSMQLGEALLPHIAHETRCCACWFCMALPVSRSTKRGDGELQNRRLRLVSQNAMEPRNWTSWRSPQVHSNDLKNLLLGGKYKTMI